MVSRGGRSKGCSNCRRRRVKCDEARPVCNRCKKLGAECDGPKNTTWINQTLADPAYSDRQLIHGVPGSLPLVAFEEELSVTFTRKHLLLGSSVEAACDIIQWNRGAEDYSRNPGLGLLRRAILSLSVTFFGSVERQPAMIDRGYRQYGDVLRQLNSHIAHGSFQTSNETLLTVTTCMLLEIFLPTGPTNFLKHVRGIEAMLDHRGAPVSTTSDAAFIIKNFRAVSVIGALAEGRASIWAKPEWKFLAPIDTQHNSLLKHKLWYLLADCTQATAERNKLFANGPLQHEEPLVATLRSLLRRSETLFSEWKSYNGSLFDDEPSFEDPGFSSRALSSSTSYMLSNAAHICILELARSIDSTLTYGRSRYEAATNILKYLESKYFMERKRSVEDNTIGFFSTKVAWEALGGLSSLEGTRLAHIVKASSKGTFATGLWVKGQQEPDQVYPKRTELTIRHRWDSPLWTLGHALTIESKVPKSTEDVDARTKSALKPVTSTPCRLDASDTCLPPSFFRSPYNLPRRTITESTPDSSLGASTPTQDAAEEFVPGPLDFSDPVLGDIF